MSVSVGLVRVYLELSGYFVISELPIREVRKGVARDITDLDIVAVRFPHRHRSGSRAPMAPLDLYLGLDPSLGATDEGVDVIVGEVKEGRARVNPGLRRVETISFALRRIGCCPEDQVALVARRILQDGEARLAMAPGVPCRVRLATFGGYGPGTAQAGILNVTLQQCTAVVEARMKAASDLVGGLHFEDPVLGLFALRQKLSDHR